MGYYSGGGRVVDVSGELRGDLYRQGARDFIGELSNGCASLATGGYLLPLPQTVYFIR